MGPGKECFGRLQRTRRARIGQGRKWGFRRFESRLLWSFGTSSALMWNNLSRSSFSCSRLAFGCFYGLLKLYTRIPRSSLGRVETESDWGFEFHRSTTSGRKDACSCWPGWLRWLFFLLSSAVASLRSFEVLFGCGCVSNCYLYGTNSFWSLFLRG